MGVGTWLDPNFEGTPPNNDGTSYKTALDNTIKVGKRIADAFAPHEKSTPDMNVLIDAGAVYVNQTLIEKAQQTVGPITAPVTNPRIDRIVIDLETGDAERIAGTEAVTPSPPTIIGNKIPVCQVALVVSQTAITNQDITDERIAGAVGAVSVLTKVTTPVTFQNTAAEETLLSIPVPAGALGTGNRLQLVLSISELDLVTDITFRVKYKSTTIAQKAFNESGTDVTDVLGQLIFDLEAAGATNSQRGFLKLFFSNALVAPTGTNNTPFGGGAAAEDSTTAGDLVVTIQFGTAVAANKITSDKATLTRYA